MYLRKYNFTLDGSTAGSLKLRRRIRRAGSTDFASSSDWTPATGDVKLSKDGGAQANIAALPSYSNGAWEFILSGSELSAKSIDVAIVDSATKAVEDDEFIVETFGNAGAMWPQDYTLNRLGIVTESRTAGVDASGRVDVASFVGISLATSGASGSISFVRGESVATAPLFPPNFASLQLVADPEVFGKYNVRVGAQALGANLATASDIAALPNVDTITAGLLGQTVTYVPWTSSNSTAGTALRTAAANTTVGIIQVGPGTFDLGANVLSLQPGVSLIGAGEGLTIITSSATASTAVKCVISPAGSGAKVGRFTIHMTGNASQFHQPLGAASSDAGHSNAQFFDILITGADSDLIVYSGATVSSATFRNVRGVAKADGVAVVGAAHLLTFYDCEFGSVGGSALGLLDYGASVACSSAAVIQLHNCRLFANLSGGGSIPPRGIIANAFSNATVNMHGGSIVTSGTGSADVERLSGAVNLFGVVCDATKFTGTVSLRNGAITHHVAGSFQAGAWAANAISSAAFSQAAADKVWSTTLKQLSGTQTFNLTGNVTGSVSGAVGSVTGAVGSVIGNVGGNVVGSVASVVSTVSANAMQLAGVSLATAVGDYFSEFFLGFNNLFDPGAPGRTVSMEAAYGVFVAGRQMFEANRINCLMVAAEDTSIGEASFTQEAIDRIAVAVESHLLDEGDSQMLINAIVGAIGNTNLDQAVLVAALRADLERTGGNLHTMLARLTAARAGYLEKLNVSGSLAHTDNASLFMADVSSLLASETFSAMTSGTGADRKFTANALSDAPTCSSAGGVIALPATARLPLGADNRRGSRLTMAEGSGARIPLTVVDAFGMALRDLADRTLRFVVFNETTKVVLFQVDDDDIDREAGAEGIDPFVYLNAKTPADSADQYRWQLWDISSATKLDLGRGVFVIETAAGGS